MLWGRIKCSISLLRNETFARVRQNRIDHETHEIHENMSPGQANVSCISWLV